MKKVKSEMKNEQSPRVVIVHDWLYGGGAEKVVEQLHRMYPEAPIYTSYCSDEWRKRLDNKVITGYLQNWPFNKLRKFLPLFRQWWFAGLDLSRYDLIISSSGNGEAKFVRGRDGATHISYSHTPPHFYWRKYDSYLKNPGFGKANFLARLGLKLLVKPLRKKDYAAAQVVDVFVANSHHIQRDIEQYYQRESHVVFPPINTDRFGKVESARNPENRKPHCIVWGRHAADKRIDIAIEACNRLELELDIIGSGSETSRLKRLAGSSVTFHGRVSDAELDRLAARADVFLFTSEEDFGISPVEAMATGMPVIAYKKGGALDYIEEGVTGLFFEEQTIDSLVKTLRAFRPEMFEEARLRTKAAEFSEAVFVQSIKAIIDDVQSKAR